KTQRLYYWGLGVFEKSLSLKVQSRYQAGLGVAYVVVNTPAIFLNLSNGVLYESSDLILQDESKKHTSTFRNSFRLLYRLSYKNIGKLEGTHFWQPSLADASDYIIRSQNSLSIKLTSWLSFTTSLIYNRVNRNATENLLFNYGLTLEKYF
ncbi:MAG TPA: DUF481 domain-containing protein, partial [Flavipsychrobacter sp.]|nr:DUF481 domain-containing protein [Flavipsychrobacter sp.]